MDFFAKMFETIDLDARAACTKLKAAFVGAGGAGKTSCIRALVGDKFIDEHLSTMGFEVQKIEVQKIDKTWIKEEYHGMDLNLLKHILHYQRNKEEHVTDELNELVKIDSSDGFNDDVLAENIALDNDIEKKTKLNDEEIKRLVEGVKLLKEESEYDLSLWDFGGQEVFYSLINIFLTENELYVVVFNAYLLLNGKPENVKYQLHQLEFWLSTVQLHAPNSRCIIVGTHADELSKRNLQAIDKILAENIFTAKKHYNIALESVDRMFCPIDSKTGYGIEELRRLMDKELKKMPSLTEEIPLSYLVGYDKMINYQDTHRSFLLLEEAEEIIFSTGIEETAEVFKFLVERGFILYFPQEELREFIILNPHWLIDGITKVLYDKGLHHKSMRIELNSLCHKDLIKFESSAIAERNLLDTIWKIAETPVEQSRFFEAVMIFMRLMCRMDREDSFYVPDLFLTLNNTDRAIEDEELFSGKVFYIDFSGLYDVAAINDRPYVCFLPTGMFGKIICEAINYCDCSLPPFPAGSRAQLKFNRARVSLSDNVSILFEVCEDESGKENRIRCLTLGTMTGEDLMLAANSMFEIVDKVKNDFYSNSQRQLSMQCLIEVDDPKLGLILGEYNFIRTKLEENELNFGFRPIPDHMRVLKVKDFRNWFDGTEVTQRPVLVAAPKREKARNQKNLLKGVLEGVGGDNLIAALRIGGKKENSRRKKDKKK